MECFSIQYDQLDGRLDPFYYKPEFMELEKKVTSITKKKLGDYIKSISGGATPNKNEKSKYYSDSDNGIIFLRVQNVSDKGINFKNSIFINKNTHEVMLKRSQVSEYDLITKITGVGRMAISTVAPKGFVGNINQHLVVIKTEDKKTSEVLAAYLNSDIAEKLASRRTTGGTRPALDFKALKSIPILWNEKIVGIIDELNSEKNEKNSEIKKLNDSKDNFILKQLGITIPKNEFQKTYVISTKKISFKRLDPRFYQKYFLDFQEILEKRSDIETIEDISEEIVSGSTPKSGGEDYTSKEEGVPFIRIVNIVNDKINLKNVLFIKRKIHDGMLKRTKLESNDILLSIAGTIGLSVIVPEKFKEGNINQALAKIKLKKGYDPDYVCAILNSSIGKMQTERLSRPAVQANINLQEVKSIKIPIPDTKIQKAVIDEFKKIHDMTRSSTLEIEKHVEESKKKIEKLLLSKN